MFQSSIGDLLPFPYNPLTIMISFALTVIIEGFLLLIMMNKAQRKTYRNIVTWSFAWSLFINLITFFLGLALFYWSVLAMY